MNNKKIIFIALILIVLLIIIVNYFQSIPGTLIVTTDPSEAEIIVNNQKYTSPTTIKLKSKEYTIVASKNGFYAENKIIKVKRFGKTEVTLTLKPNDNKIPLDSLIPYSADHFLIEKDYQTNIYTITVFAIFNRPDQLDSYKEQLVQYHKEALDWIKTQGVDPASLKITWLPE